MKNCILTVLLVLSSVSLQAAGVVSAKDIAGDGTKPCAEAIQRLIDANPNREIFFPDGTYLLDRPVCTPSAS